jgi:hypothetical protein
MEMITEADDSRRAMSRRLGQLPPAIFADTCSKNKGLRRRGVRRKKILVKNLNGEIITLEVDPTETINGVKAMVADSIHHPALQRHTKGFNSYSGQGT